MKRVRAGIIGLGVGEKHIAGYREHPCCEVVSICDTNGSKLAEVKSRYPELHATEDPFELLDDPQIDVISIASYDDAHYEQIMRALKQGKHIFAEKPMVLYEHELREVRGALASKPELVMSCNVPLRLSPRFQEIRKLIQAGEFGQLFHLEGDYDYGRRHKLTDGWRGQLPYYSVVLGGAIHLVDLLLWLSGEQVVEVSALSSQIATGGTQFSHPDFVVALLRFKSGATAKVAANLGCVSKHFHGVRIYGTKATFVNGLPDGVLYREAPAPEEADPSPVDSPYPGVHKGALIHSFIEQVLGQGSAAVPASEMFQTLDVCFAIERACKEGKTVPVQAVG